MIRPSALAMADLCAHSAELAERFPQSSAAAERGTEWHQRLERVIRGQARDPKLEAIVASFPAYVRIEAEVKVRLVDPDTDDLITEGTSDVVLTHEDGTLTIIDFKTGQHRDYTLQLEAYGISLALERKAPAFRWGVAYLDEDEVRLSEWYRAGDHYWTVLDRVKKAASGDRSRPVVGAWCHGCFQRKHCSAWLLPAAPDALVPYVQKPKELTVDKAIVGLRLVAALREMADVAEAHIRDFAREHEIREGGQVYAPGPKRGREYVPVSELPSDLRAELASRGLIRRSRDSEEWRWRKAR